VKFLVNNEAEARSFEANRVKILRHFSSAAICGSAAKRRSFALNKDEKREFSQMAEGNATLS
jgi:hypothetical protein